MLNLVRSVLSRVSFSSVEEEDEETTTVKKVKIHLLIDQSGSMCSRRLSIVKGYNDFLQKQKDILVEDEECYVSTYMFNDTIKVLYEDVSLSDVQALSTQEYEPDGSTALWDSTAFLYKKILESQETARHIVVILTDGEENASVTISKKELAELRQRVSSKAEIIYMGSNQDAITNGLDIGAMQGTSLNYNDDNLLDAIESLGHAVRRGRTGDDLHFTPVERARSSGTSSLASTTTIVH
jgi:Mg-chelatase subunit ChlD